MPIRADNERAELLRALGQGLAKRRSLPGGAAREGVDGHLVSIVHRARGAVARPVRQAIAAAPPRDVAIPLALALFSQPHIARTFIDPDEQGTHPGDGPVSFPPDSIRLALGLEAWELEDLRDDVDRRASQHLLQLRAARWLWNHWGAADGAELFRRLFPGAPVVDGVRVEQTGAHLYAVSPTSAASNPLALLLPWVSSEEGLLPMDAFAGRYVDDGLRDALGRGIGASPGKVVDLLDRMVALIPARDAARYVRRDHWRWSGAAALTGLARSYRQTHRIDAPLDGAAVGLEGWIAAEGGRIRLGNAEAVFDQLAMHRIAQAMRLASAAIISKAFMGAPLEVDAEELAAFDAAAHLHAALAPIVAWPGHPATANAVARFLDMRPQQAAGLLTRVGDRWRERAARWLRPPTPDDPWPVSTRMADFLVRLWTHVQTLVAMPAADQPHRDATLLFVAHRIAEAADSELLPPEPDIPGIPEALTDTFWGAWQRLFASLAPDNDTWSGSLPM